jgi:hypothetical protein
MISQAGIPYPVGYDSGNGRFEAFGLIVDFDPHDSWGAKLCHFMASVPMPGLRGMPATTRVEPTASAKLSYHPKSISYHKTVVQLPR